MKNITLTLVLGNLTLATAQVVISYSPPDGAYLNFIATRQDITADAQDSATLTFTTKNAQGQPILGIARTLYFQVLDRDYNPVAPDAVTMTPTRASDTPEAYTAQLYTAQLSGNNGWLLGHPAD